MTLRATTALLAAAIAASLPAAAAEQIGPRQGAMLEIGTKRAVAYFLAGERQCNLTLLIGDRLSDDQIPGAATRVTLDVAAGSAMRVEASGGKSLAFGCAADAGSMTVDVLSRVAGVPRMTR